MIPRNASQRGFGGGDDGFDTVIRSEFDPKDTSPPLLVRQYYSSASQIRVRQRRQRVRSVVRSLVLLLVAAAVISSVVLVAKKYSYLLFREPPILGMHLVRETPPPVSLRLPSLPFSEGEYLSYRLEKRASIDGILQDFGVTQSLEKELREVLKKETQDDPKKSETLPQPGETVTIQLGDSWNVERVVIPLQGQREFVAARTIDGDYRGFLRGTPRRGRDKVLVGVVSQSFAATATRAKVPYQIIDDLVDLFSERVEFKKDFHKGDRFTVIFKESLSKAGEPISAGPILAAELNVKGKRFTMIRYVGSDGVARYFDGEGNGQGQGFLRYPLQFSRITSYFSQGRFHPVLKVKRPHNGIDFAAPVGTPVRSIASGTVLVAGWNGPAGNMIKIQHDKRYATAYLHLSKIAAGVSEGAKVTRGQIIGAVGTTGLSTGPHLHFSFYDNGKYVDPFQIDLPRIDSLAPDQKIDRKYLERVLFTLEHYRSIDLTSVDWG